MALVHDSYRILASQNLAYAVAGGTSAASAVLGPQTYWVELVAPGVYSSAGGVRVAIGDGTPTATGTSTLLPYNFPLIFACSPGQKVAAVGNEAVTGTLSITELS